MIHIWEGIKLCTKMCTIKKLQDRSERAHPNQPQDWNNRTTLSPVVKLVKTISPGESIHVLPNIKLLTLVGGGTSSRITPSLFSFKRVLQPKMVRQLVTTVLWGPPCKSSHGNRNISVNFFTNASEKNGYQRPKVLVTNLTRSEFNWLTSKLNFNW